MKSIFGRLFAAFFKRAGALLLTITFCFLWPAAPGFALDNDLDLSRLGTFELRNTAPECAMQACGVVTADRQAFENLVTDLGQVLAPRFAAPSETLGEAGFAVQSLWSWSTIPADEEYWERAVEDRAPDSTLFMGHLQVRKGLPFSFEIAGNLGYLFNSEMFTLGTDLKWALNEGFYYFPDIAVRGSVNTLMGADDLNLTNAGWDVSISKTFGISGLLALSPYAGYQQLFIIASSRLLNAYPQDPRSPQIDDNPADGNTTFSPEFVFEQYNTSVNRFFFGTRLNVWILNFVADVTFGDPVTQFMFSGGVDF